MSDTPETQAPRAPVKYLVLEKSLIGNELFEAGQEAMYDGLPAENLKPLCDIGKARYQEYLDSNAARVKAMAAANPASGIAGDAEAFAKAVGAAIAEANREHAAQIQVLAEAVAKLQAAQPPAKAGKAAKEPDPLT